MNEEELRLLRIAVGSLADDDHNAEPTPAIANAQSADTDIADIGNLRDEDLDSLLSQLQEGLSQQPEPVPAAALIPQDNSNTEFHFDPGLLEQIVDALSRGDGATAVKGGDSNFAIQQAFETFSRSGNDDNSQNSTPTPEPPNHMVQQRQEHAGILISNEIYRQRNGTGDVPEDDDPEKAAERERVREENRERKKRWREVNQDRNKDNDLRCRVTKRAARLYGQQSSPAKSAWIASEFNKRKQKREQKEKARGDGSSLSNVFNTQLQVFNDFRSGDPQPQFTMDGLVDLIMRAPPEVVTELHKVATEISGVQLPLVPANHNNFAAKPPPQQPSFPPTSVMQDQVNPTPQPPEQGRPESSDATTLEGLLQGLAAGGEVPEGFDLILAELAGETTKPPTSEPEPAVESPKLIPIEPPPTPEGMEIDSNFDEINVDELLAALAAANSDPDLAQDVLGDTVMSTQDCDDDDDRLEALNALLGSDGEGTDFDMTEEALEKIINECGIDLSTADVGDLTAQLASIDEALSQHNEETILDIPPEVLEGMSVEEINQLLGALNSAEEPVPDVSPTPPPLQDLSAHYTPENVAAILKAIFEGITPPLPQPTKRQLPPPPPPPPPRPMFQCSVDVLRPPTSIEAKRLVPLKPPPYMTMPPRTSTSIGVVQLPIPLPPKRKTGEEEKKIKAMGFPPLMAGIKRKAE
ncbi:hypothetical protein BDD12DRAFT_528505 [Trichophaea hybrida]|nr:hypothetical protein BDD12DRAFT_528505 [Trichophaea hybrida]